MSTTAPSGPATPGQQPRVRERARDAAALMVFSLVLSAALACGLLLLSRLAGR